MIIDYEGRPTTPKKKAGDILMDSIGTALGYGVEDQLQEATPGERKKVRKQMWLIADRMAKLAGYDKAWSN